MNYTCDHCGKEARSIIYERAGGSLHLTTADEEAVTILRRAPAVVWTQLLCLHHAAMFTTAH